MQFFFTLGLSTRDDKMAYATVVAFRTMHPHLLDHTEILVIDNSEQVIKDGLEQPNRYATELEKQLKHVPGVRYLRRPGAPSSCLYKEQVFQNARGKYVLCCDSHVFFEQGAIDALLNYYESHPESSDLVMGPLVSVTGKITATQQHLYASESFPVPHGAAVYQGVVCRGNQLGIWAIDERGLDPAHPPYEIQQQGTFAFACRRDAWPSFHPQFWGFGGNETYLMEKFRQRGDKVLCLPAFRAIHSFYEPEGKPYTPVLFDRVRNYLLGFKELGRDDLYKATLEFFGRTNPGTVRQAEQALLKGPEVRSQGSGKGPTPKPSAASRLLKRHPLQDEYERLLSQLGVKPGGAIPFPLFQQLSMVKPDKKVLEFGAGLSTLLLSSRGVPLKTIEHSANWVEKLKPLIGENVELIYASLTGDPPWYDWQPAYGELYDLILIDGPPGNAETDPGRAGALGHVEHLLAPGGTIFLDDTQRPAEQSLAEELAKKLGLKALTFPFGARKFTMLIPPPEPLGEGPGTELKKLFSEKKFPACQQCEKLARQMNQWGVAGCRERFDEIIDDILPRARNWLNDKKPAKYAQALFGPITAKVGDAVLRTLIAGQVRKAIDAAEQQENVTPSQPVSSSRELTSTP